MEMLKNIALFIQNQVLAMKWLDEITKKILKYFSINLDSKLGGSLNFFIYDAIKITILLCTLIFIVSYIQSYFPPERSKKILGKFKGIWANVIAALLGTVTPFCSCSSIPLFIGFTSSGLPIGVTFSFLISSPMVDLASLVLLISIFGLKIGLAYIILGLIIAVIGGTIIEKLKLENQIEDFILNIPKGIDLEATNMTKLNRIIFAREQVKQTFLKVFPFILLGVGIGAFIHNWLPQEFIEKILGNNNLFGVLIAILVGVPMYADIFGTIPIAEALISKGAMLGTILAFMMAVTTLSLPSIIMLRQAIKMKLLIIFVTITSLGIIVVGYLFNLFLYLFI